MENNETRIEWKKFFFDGKCYTVANAIAPYDPFNPKEIGYGVYVFENLDNDFNEFVDDYFFFNASVGEIEDYDTIHDWLDTADGCEIERDDFTLLHACVVFDDGSVEFINENHDYYDEDEVWMP